MVEVELCGELAEQAGTDVLHLEVESPAEAVRAVSFMVPNARRIFRDSDWQVLVDGVPAGMETLYKSTPNLERVVLLPQLAGAGDGVGPGKIIGGIFLMVASFIVPVLGTVLFAVGAAIAISGLTKVLAPKPPINPDLGEDANNRQSALFSGSSNLSQSGQPIPVVYGEFLTGSLRINSDIDVSPDGAVQTELVSESTVSVTDILSEGEIGGLGSLPLTKVFFDNTPVQQADGGFNFQGVRLYENTGAGSYVLNESIEQLYGVGVVPTNELGTTASSEAGAVLRQIDAVAATSVKMIMQADSLYAVNSTTGALDEQTLDYKVQIKAANAASFVDVNAGISAPRPVNAIKSASGGGNPHPIGLSTAFKFGKRLTGLSDPHTVFTDDVEFRNINAVIYEPDLTVGLVPVIAPQPSWPPAHAGQNIPFYWRLGVRLAGTSGPITWVNQESVYSYCRILVRNGFWGQDAYAYWPYCLNNFEVDWEVDVSELFIPEKAAPTAISTFDITGLASGEYDVYCASGPTTNTVAFPSFLLSWADSYTNTGQIEGRALQPYRWQFQLQNLAQYGTSPYSLAVKRDTQDRDQSETRDLLRWSAYAEQITDQFQVDNTALATLSYSAESVGGRTPKVGYLLKGMKVKVPSNLDTATRTYTGTWDGTFAAAPVWFDNPVWCLYDFLTNDRYGMGLSDSQVDKWSFYDVSLWVDESVSDGAGGTEPRFRFDHSFSTREPALQIVQTLASAMQARAWWGGGMVFLSADRPADPSRIFTNANVVEGQFKYTSVGMQTRASTCLVSYRNREQQFKPDVDAVDRPHMIDRFGKNQVEITALGTTRWSQARRLARYELLTAELEAEMVTFKIGYADAFIEPGQILEIRDQARNRARQGGRTGSVSDRLFILDSNIEAS